MVWCEVWHLCQFDGTLLCLDVASPGHVLWECHMTLLVLHLTLRHITTGRDEGEGQGRGWRYRGTTARTRYSPRDEVCNVLVLAEVGHLGSDQFLHWSTHACGDHLDVAALGRRREGRLAGEEMFSMKWTCSLVAELNLLCVTVVMHQQTASDVCQLDLHIGRTVKCQQVQFRGRWKQSCDAAPHSGTLLRCC